jgi:hypothetical protein
MALSRNHWRCRPFAARRDEPISRQHLQHVVPARPFAASGKAFGPEAIELQLAPQDAGEPAGAPLARPAEPHLREPQADHVFALGGLATIFRKQGERARTPGAFVEHFDAFSPRFGLGGVDLAEVKHVALDHPSAGEAFVLDDAPVEMRLPVLPPLGLSQEHRDKTFATSRRPCGIRLTVTWSSLQAFSAMFPTSASDKSKTWAR